MIKAVDKFGNAVPVPSAADGSRGFKAEISGAQASTSWSCLQTQFDDMLLSEKQCLQQLLAMSAGLGDYV